MNFERVDLQTGIQIYRDSISNLILFLISILSSFCRDRLHLSEFIFGIFLPFPLWIWGKRVVGVHWEANLCSHFDLFLNNWFQDENGSRSIYEDRTSRFFPPPPRVPRMLGLVSGDTGFMDDSEDSFQELSNSSHQRFNILCSGDKDGFICFSIFGIFPIGKIVSCSFCTILIFWDSDRVFYAWFCEATYSLLCWRCHLTTYSIICLMCHLESFFLCQNIHNFCAPSSLKDTEAECRLLNASVYKVHSSCS